MMKEDWGKEKGRRVREEKVLVATLGRAEGRDPKFEVKVETVERIWGGNQKPNLETREVIGSLVVGVPC